MLSENPFPSQNNFIFLAVVFSTKSPVSLFLYPQWCLSPIQERIYRRLFFPPLCKPCLGWSVPAHAQVIPVLKCLPKAEQMFTFLLGQSCCSGLLCQGDEGWASCMQQLCAAQGIAPLLIFPINFCLLSFSLSNEASNWHWRIALVSVQKNPACGTQCCKNEFHFIPEAQCCLIYLIIATGNSKEWDTSSVQTKTSNCQHSVLGTDLKDRGRNTGQNAININMWRHY